MQIVDPHIHLWDLSTGLYPGLEKPSNGFIGNNEPIAKTYVVNDFLADAGEIEVVKAVHVEAFPTDPVAETQHLQAMADVNGAGLPQGIVANADLSAPNVQAVLEALAAFPNLRGVRQVLNRHSLPLYNYVEKDFMQEPAWREGFKLLKRFNLSFDLQLYPKQMADAAAIAAANPETPFILNHAGMWVDRTLTGWREWRNGMRMLAGQANIVVKISGLGMFDHDWTVESIRPLVLSTIDAFGTERAMFASNFPVDKLFSDYQALWQAYAAIVADFSEDEQSALFRANAERVYRI